MKTPEDNLSIIQSNDNSHTLYRSDIDEHYHSIHGAIQESEHVFIKAGIVDFLNTNPKMNLKILEIGFGTGLNVLLTLNLTKKSENLKIEYTTLEPYPIAKEIIEKLNYPQSDLERKIFNQIHRSSWSKRNKIIDTFILKKEKVKLQNFNSHEFFDIIFYDAFGPKAQKEMWDISRFKKLYDLIYPNGKLVTYCAKGQVRRDLQKVGFKVERLKGPKGKREMIRATRN